MERRKNHLKKLIAFFVVFSFLFSFETLPVLAGPGDSEKAKEYKDNLMHLNDELDEKGDALKKGKAAASELTKEIKDLDKKIYSSEVEINKLEKEINTTKGEIREKLEDLDKKRREVENQDEALRLRLRTMYKNGDVGIFSVLLGSGSISEFLTNIEMVKRVYKGDAALLSSLEERYDEMEGVKNELVGLKNKLETQKAGAAEKKSALDADKKTVAGKKARVEADNKELEAQIDAINKEANAISALILSLQGSADYVGGEMLWPSAASRYITSPFGMRIHPILRRKKMHTGIDIAARAGTDILAANAGRVIKSGWNNGYGYMVMIDHGGGTVTLYAHASKLLVKQGDIVGRGETVAKVGTTGLSTGPHLHFEVRQNGQFQNPLNYVKP